MKLGKMHKYEFYSSIFLAIIFLVFVSSVLILGRFDWIFAALFLLALFAFIYFAYLEKYLKKKKLL